MTGQRLKVSAELAARVQEALRLETKKEAEIAVGAVIDALEYCLLRNLGTDGFSLKLGGFGKFKVRHLKPATRKVGWPIVSPTAITEYSPSGAQDRVHTITTGISNPSALAFDGVSDL